MKDSSHCRCPLVVSTVVFHPLLIGPLTTLFPLCGLCVLTLCVLWLLQRQRHP